MSIPNSDFIAALNLKFLFYDNEKSRYVGTNKRISRLFILKVVLILKIIFYLCVIVVASMPASLTAESLRIAVASNFKSVTHKLKTQYENIYGANIQVIAGSSAKLMAQIIHGAPFDIFLSADQEKIEVLYKKQLIIPETRSIYAVGQLVLYCPELHCNNVECDLAKMNADSVDTLLNRKDVNKVAMANPKLAPYGLAAKQVLEQAKLYRKLESKWVFGENVNQSFQFIKTGNVDCGFVAFSQVISQGADTKNYWLISEDRYQPIKQEGAVLSQSKNKQQAINFMQWLAKRDVQMFIQEYGYRSASAL
ncbi:molybdate ABC transporter substrate-binding protein [Pleionea sediminis]|uniref:molybdate ABC transporter substrate-binding protein n=1 Tax=Pleionea sediminis TaxID=2569479 RepID=UPI001184960E|nr:molybdate ABC transporter substrate-binding protein [Pleionea sediminis]